jgi:hypothetical protein
MIEKISTLINEVASTTDLMGKIAVIIGSNFDIKRTIITLDRKTGKFIKTADNKSKEIMMIYDNKSNFSVAFKNYIKSNFTDMDNFFKNSMWVDTLSDAKIRLKKEVKYLNFDELDSEK